MKFTVLITLVMIALVGFVGVVSAEQGLLYYDYSDLTGIESSHNPDTPIDAKGNMRYFQVEKIENFPKVEHMVIGINQNVYTYSSKAGLTNWDCNFTAKIYGGPIIGTGRFYCTKTSSTHAVLAYEFDDYDIGQLTGNYKVDFKLDENDAYIMAKAFKGYGTLTDTVLGHFNLIYNIHGEYIKNVCTVYQRTQFHQSLGYYYDYDLNTMDLKLKRNSNTNNVLITDQDGNIRLDDTTSGDLNLFYADVFWLRVNVTNSYTDYVWTNVLPLAVQYDVIKDPKNPVLGNVTPSEIDINAYRASIIALPLIGNMSEPYLDFVDDMYTDAFAMAKTVIDTLMYPVDLVNYNMITVTDILKKSIDDIDDRFGILTAPMTKIIVAIPEKVMGFFVFALGLDIIKIILAWRV